MKEGKEKSEVASEREAWVRSPKVLRTMGRRLKYFSECHRKPLGVSSKRVTRSTLYFRRTAFGFHMKNG